MHRAWVGGFVMDVFATIEQDPAGLGDAELRAAVGMCGELRGRVDAAEAALLTEASRRRSFPEGAVGLVRDTQRSSSREAKRRADTATGLARIPAALDGLAQGTISRENAELLARTARTHPEGVTARSDELVAKASSLAPEQFRHAMQRLRNECDGDGGLSRHNRIRRRRKVTMFDRDGMGVLIAELDPVAHASLRAVIAKRAQRMFHSDARLPAGRQRTLHQRQADALVEAMTGTTSSAQPASAGGAGATVIAITDVDTLMGKLSLHPGHELADGTPVPIDTLRRIACDARVLPMIFAADGQPLYVGRGKRLATSVQQLAVVARDRTCIACDTPADWCQTHHIQWWQHGGRTDIDNLCLLCSHHHHLVHEGGWTVHRRSTGSYTLRAPPRRSAA